MASTTATRPAQTRSNRKRHTQNEGIIPLLARAVREVEASAQRGKATPANRTKFHVIALLMREERARIKTEEGVAESERAETLKRLDGIAGILAKTAARDTSLITLLEPAAPITEATRALKRKMLMQAGIELPEEAPAPEPRAAIVPPELAERQVEPAGIEARMRANPFLAPDLEPAQGPTPVVRLANWELLSPLLKSFEQGGGGSACMALPEPPVPDRLAPRGLELMPHQARLLASVRDGHRSFLLADEPGLGKTAQSVLAASVAGAYPLLVVVPNVVKMNWAREAQRWTPQRRVTVIHGDGQDIDAFADIFVVNYEILDRHLSWISRFGFEGMVVDEAHMIKNVQSQRSRNVLAIADRIRERVANPLLIALTGTPLINDIDDFRAIWRFLGWTDAEKPGRELMAALEANGYTPADAGFYPAARQSVVDLGIVRRRKLDVAADLPAKRVVDLPVELDDDLGRGIREAERQLAAKLYDRFSAMKNGKLGEKLSDEALVRMVCAQELEESNSSADGTNVFTMVRQIGQAKAGLAADYAAQLARSVGKVVFFAKHIDVMDRAEAAFAERGLTTISIRGDQTATARQEQIDAFNQDPDVAIAVCSLTAAGVGVNLQAASDVVLAELSWTDAEQTQAIDRVHRIGQEEPVTAWRIVAAQTIDAKIAELIDRKAGLAARALDGAEAKHEDEDSVQLAALMQVLNEAIAAHE
ncbi:helicase [Leucobacter sp. OLJS4]|uniref:DEAD/DEAH box helicase n=1 Tax=unclassified Leucobacter TaxID=2621730 RepID=UPI000C1786BF|nr:MULTISPECIES: DEAD/DEAH box helicase [unclassified Leucobacter]PII84494.1 helicase [Leucobacter sp. OLCALW19]PII88731.1 helicase [Leucobacter sp. OLTLW20]PII90911.1 helicase [Leucobacter sp. OLAS13]PII97658.1 helicase [Leucobacter sp. OLDS2]PIJ00999.1 helicase [Leucobacter sp. OLCS4]